MTASGVSRFVTAPDGLRLHVREYGERGSRHVLVACLCDAVHAAVAGGEPVILLLAPIDESSHRDALILLGKAKLVRFAKMASARCEA